MQSTDIDLHFESGELRSAKQQDDAKTGEVKHKDEQGGGKEGGAKDREYDIFPHVERVRAEGTGRGFEFRVKARDGVAYDADDD